jgi:hypothetical protein
MRVRIVVELDIEADELSPDLPAQFSPEQLREAAAWAVTRALDAAQEGGFSHPLEDETAIVVAGVHALPD